MTHLKKTFTLLTVLILGMGSRTTAQDFFKFASAQEVMRQLLANERTKEVMQDNEYESTGDEAGIFLRNPLMLNGKPLDYSVFAINSKGALTVVKGAATHGQTMEIPFYIYLRRKGTKVLIPGKETPDPRQIKVDLSEILKCAKPGDQLLIEPIRKEDGPAKRILKLFGGGC